MQQVIIKSDPVLQNGYGSEASQSLKRVQQSCHRSVEILARRLYLGRLLTGRTVRAQHAAGSHNFLDNFHHYHIPIFQLPSCCNMFQQEIQESWSRF